MNEYFGLPLSLFAKALTSVIPVLTLRITHTNLKSLFSVLQFVRCHMYSLIVNFQLCINFDNGVGAEDVRPNGWMMIKYAHKNWENSCVQKAARYLEHSSSQRVYTWKKCPTTWSRTCMLHTYVYMCSSTWMFWSTLHRTIRHRAFHVHMMYTSFTSW